MSRRRWPRCRRLWPDISVVSSHQITREWREYERTNTAVLSAYVQPTAERYLSRLHNGLRSEGFDESPYIMQSNCGVDSLESVLKIPITMVESGPGLRLLGCGRARQADRRAQRAGARYRRHHGQMLADRERRGQDQDRLLDRARPHARPATRSWCPWSTWSRSAMAAARSPGSTISASCMSARNRRARCPGPAAYGRGGTKATTTDANLWLGRINKDYFCGGEIAADMTVDRSADQSGRREARRSMPTRRRAASSASPTTTWSMR